MLNKLIEDNSILDNLPASIQVFLKDAETLNKLNNIISFFKLSDDDALNLGEIVLDIATGYISIYELSDVLEQELDIDFEIAMKISDKLFEDLFINLKDDLEVEYAVKQNAEKVELSIVDDKEIKKSKEKKGKVDIIIDKIVADLGIKLDDEHLKDRFYDVSKSYLNNVRTEDQFKAVLSRGAKAGGMGFDDVLSGKIVDFFASKVKKEEVEEKKEKEGKISEETKKDLKKITGEAIKIKPKVPKTIPVKTAPILEKKEIDFKKEEEEAESLETKVEKLKEVRPNHIVSKVDKALAEINISFPSVDLNNRLKAVVDSRLRDVRTSDQVFVKLLSGVDKGGIGFSKKEADRVSLILNKYVSEEEDDLYKSKVAEIKKVEAKAVKQKEDKKKIHEQDLEDRYVKLMGKSKKMQKKMKNGALPVIEKKEKKIKIASSTNVKTEIPKHTISPVLEDIKFTPKLTGPVDEIARITIEDFRKMSGDPKEALLKIKDKLNLLREDSFVKYQQGLDGWKKSPIYMEYLDILGASIEAGTATSLILQQKNTLTEEEFNVIMDSGIGN